MTYKVKIGGKDYNLPARTLAVDGQIEEIGALDGKYRAGELSRREVVERIHAFVEALVPGAFPPVEECDTNDLTKAATDIISSYDAPRLKNEADAQAARAREVLNRPEIQKLLTIAPLLAKQK